MVGGRVYTPAPRLLPDGRGGLQLHFQLQAPDAVHLRVYDIAGRLVHEAQGGYPAGENDIAWDGRDASGRPAASGIYVFRLQTGRSVSATKGVWMR